MQAYSRNWTIYTIVLRKKKIDPKPPYQRGPVWNEAKRQLLIDSILRKYDIPKVYLRKLAAGGPYEHEVIDGQQRLKAIWDFKEGHFSLGDESDDLPAFGDLTGKTHDQLPTDAQDAFGLYELTIAEVQDASELEIRDLFRRLQEGVPLNPAERRNALTGKMRDFVADLADHKVFPCTSIPSKRFAWHDLAAHITCLDLAGGPTEVKAANLKKMYEAENDFDSDGPIAKKIKRVLNYLAKVLKSKPPEMDIKWGFVDLFLTVSTLDGEFVLNSREDDILQFYLSFESDRRAVEDPADLLLPGQDEWADDLFRYIEAFQREGATRANVEKRHQVYLRRLLRDVADLVPKDPTRAFSNDQRLVIWRRDKGICQSCKTALKFEDMHADHILPHAKGGMTTVANGQTLCEPCNTKKGAEAP